MYPKFIEVHSIKGNYPISINIESIVKIYDAGKWALVRNYIEVPESDGIDVAFLLDAADNSTGMTAGDLIKTPLYRMKVTK